MWSRIIFLWLLVGLSGVSHLLFADGCSSCEKTPARPRPTERPRDTNPRPAQPHHTPADTEHHTPSVLSSNKPRTERARELDPTPPSHDADGSALEAFNQKLRSIDQDDANAVASLVEGFISNSPKKPDESSALLLSKFGRNSTVGKLILLRQMNWNELSQAYAKNALSTTPEPFVQIEHKRRLEQWAVALGRSPESTRKFLDEYVAAKSESDRAVVVAWSGMGGLFIQQRKLAAERIRKWRDSRVDSQLKEDFLNGVELSEAETSPTSPFHTAFNKAFHSPTDSVAQKSGEFWGKVDQILATKGAQRTVLQKDLLASWGKGNVGEFFESLKDESQRSPQARTLTDKLGLALTVKLKNGKAVIPIAVNQNSKMDKESDPVVVYEPGVHSEDPATWRIGEKIFAWAGPGKRFFGTEVSIPEDAEEWNLGERREPQVVISPTPRIPETVIQHPETRRAEIPREPDRAIHEPERVPQPEPRVANNASTEPRPSESKPSERSVQNEANRPPQRDVVVQKKCPVTGALLGSMGDPISVTVEGKTVQVCCEGCVEKLKKNPKKYLQNL